MSEREVRRAEVLSRVAARDLRLWQAAELMGVGYRQAKRLWKRYREEGAQGVVHGSAGRRSNRSKAEEFRRKVLAVVRNKYSGDERTRFGPTLAAEHLEADEGLKVDAETLRRWMLAEGLWSRQRGRKAHRRRRERRKHFGELVQLDGSFHAWLEQRGPELCLMNMVDDATGVTLSQLHEQETIWAAADVFRAWVEKYGVPRALYTDWKNVYVREPNEAERCGGIVPLTQFGRMCARLGTRVIAANSPQAKGRVERNNGVQQDRLIKKLRLEQIGERQQANRYLRQRYLPDHNRRFARPPAEPQDYHLKSPAKRELDAIFRLEEERTISNDWVVRYHGRFLQIERQSRYAPAGAKVVVSEGRDGSLRILYRGRAVEWQEIAAPARPAPPPPAHRGHAVELRRKLHRPAANHPWRSPGLTASQRAAGVG
jgi:transposase